MKCVVEPANCVNNYIGLSLTDAALLRIIREVAVPGVPFWANSLAEYLGLPPPEDDSAYQTCCQLAKKGLLIKRKSGAFIFTGVRWFRFDDTTKTLVEYQP